MASESPYTELEMMMVSPLASPRGSPVTGRGGRRVTVAQIMRESPSPPPSRRGWPLSGRGRLPRGIVRLGPPASPDSTQTPPSPRPHDPGLLGRPEFAWPAKNFVRVPPAAPEYRWRANEGPIPEHHRVDGVLSPDGRSIVGRLIEVFDEVLTML